MPASKPECRWGGGSATAPFPLVGREIGDVRAVVGGPAPCSPTASSPGRSRSADHRRVYFTPRGEHLAQPLDSISPVVFSETMRDLDLVVSAAHADGWTQGHSTRHRDARGPHPRARLPDEPG